MLIKVSRTFILDFCVPSRIRTRTPFRAKDFKSSASAVTPRGPVSVPGTTRTYDLGFRKALLYLTELWELVVQLLGIEPKHIRV